MKSKLIKQYIFKIPSEISLLRPIPPALELGEVVSSLIIVWQKIIIKKLDIQSLTTNQ